MRRLWSLFSAGATIISALNAEIMTTILRINACYGTNFSMKLRAVMSSIMRRRNGLMGFSLIGVLLS
jgi:fumarate reductase subunit D